MIILKLVRDQKQFIPVAGTVVHLKVESIEEVLPGVWHLKAEDVTPLPGAEQTGYGCHVCGIIEVAAEDGGLPKEWVEKKFPTQSFFLCPDCQKDGQVCRVCGCSELYGCIVEGDPEKNEDIVTSCHWVEKDLCSACVGKETKKA